MSTWDCGICGHSSWPKEFEECPICQCNNYRVEVFELKNDLKTMAAVENRMVSRNIKLRIALEQAREAIELKYSQCWEGCSCLGCRTLTNIKEALNEQRPNK